MEVTFSDKTLKKNIETIDDALNKVCSLRGVYFNWNPDSVADKGLDMSKRFMGCIAQEVQEVIPEVVVVAPQDNKTLTVGYGALVGVLIEAIKQLADDNKKLKEQVDKITKSLILSQ